MIQYVLGLPLYNFTIFIMNTVKLNPSNVLNSEWSHLPWAGKMSHCPKNLTLVLENGIVNKILQIIMDFGVFPK